MGSTVVEILARLGIGIFVIVDFDVVEESNLTRQSGFTKNDVGKSKVEVIKKHIYYEYF
ncbi:HesA/MoeB/ThiF family protein [Streptococcus ruminicola]|uniref:HesA/MoeB/ThiF family protein n=1 Tax=Streptococcus ruminicola TaxID=2686210 RepID=UPI003BF530B9